ncbi:MAG: hypothetical protein ACYC7D_15360 [Nitrososphaerales archaeon]
MLPESEDEASEINLNNAKFEAEQKLSRVAKREAKNFNDEFNAWVKVGNDLKPISIELWSPTQAELRVPLKGREEANEIPSLVNEALSRSKGLKKV